MAIACVRPSSSAPMVVVSMEDGNEYVPMRVHCIASTEISTITPEAGMSRDCSLASLLPLVPSKNKRAAKNVKDSNFNFAVGGSSAGSNISS